MGEARLTEYKGKQYLELSVNAVTLMGGKPQGEAQPKRQAQLRQGLDQGHDEPPF